MQTSYTPNPAEPIALDAFAELRRELVNWAEPVIADRVIDVYRDYRLGFDPTYRLAAQHRRLWRAILLDNRDSADELRHRLRDDLDQFGLDSRASDQVDESVMEELVDVVLKRFRTSARQMKAFSMILMGAATQIGASRAVSYN